MSGRATPPAAAPARQRLAPQERREQLAAAAVRVVAARGFRRSTADAVARAAGVSKGLLWHYFADLDELMEYTARRTLVVVTDVVASAVDLTRPAPVVIRSAVRAAADLLRTHPAERRALQQISTELRGPDGSPRLTVADYGELYTAQEGIFRRGQADGDFRRLDPRVMAVTYQGAVDAMLDYLEANPHLDPDRFADTVADVLLDGLCTAGRDAPVD